MSPRTIPPITIDHKSFRLTVPEITLEAGEILGIFGKSGAGKTSYLHRIRQLLTPGTAHTMSQFDSLLEEITVRQNIELGLAAAGRTLEEAGTWERDYATLLKDFEVDRHLHKYPRAMSGGQRKRAEIVRSLILNPPVLLLDEPFTGIGHLFEAVCTREILARAKTKSGITMIVSHDFDLLCTFSHRILLVDDLGIIGFVPTNDASWHPENVRTAWTLGVQNVLDATMLRELQTEGLFPVPHGHSVGFFGTHAVWGKQDTIVLRVPRTKILSERSSMLHGTLSTTVTVASSGEPFSLTGRGVPNAEDDVMLGISEAWPLTA